MSGLSDDLVVLTAAAVPRPKSKGRGNWDKEILLLVGSREPGLPLHLRVFNPTTNELSDRLCSEGTNDPVALQLGPGLDSRENWTVQGGDDGRILISHKRSASPALVTLSEDLKKVRSVEYFYIPTNSAGLAGLGPEGPIHFVETSDKYDTVTIAQAPLEPLADEHYERSDGQGKLSQTARLRIVAATPEGDFLALGNYPYCSYFVRASSPDGTEIRRYLGLSNKDHRAAMLKHEGEVFVVGLYQPPCSREVVGQWDYRTQIIFWRSAEPDKVMRFPLNFKANRVDAGNGFFFVSGEEKITFFTPPLQGGVETRFEHPDAVLCLDPKPRNGSG
jgi:hypothetical protein